MPLIRTRWMRAAASSPADGECVILIQKQTAWSRIWFQDDFQSLCLKCMVMFWPDWRTLQVLHNHKSNITTFNRKMWKGFQWDDFSKTGGYVFKNGEERTGSWEFRLRLLMLLYFLLERSTYLSPEEQTICKANSKLFCFNWLIYCLPHAAWRGVSVTLAVKQAAIQPSPGAEDLSLLSCPLFLRYIVSSIPPQRKSHQQDEYINLE